MLCIFLVTIFPSNIIYFTFYFVIISVITSAVIKIFHITTGLLPDFKSLKIKSSFVKSSSFLNTLNLAISHNPSLDLLCRFSALRNSFSEIFFILASFSSPIFNIFLRLLFTLRSVSYLLRIFNNSLVDIF